MVHKKHNIVVLMLSVLLLSGCLRMQVEVENRADCIEYPPSRIYSGTAYSLKPHSIFFGTPPLPYYILFAPFEFIYDTLMLPRDLALTILYYHDKPLNELIRNNDIKTLALRLKSGAAPDFIDTRYSDTAASRYYERVSEYSDAKKRFPVSPLMEAFRLRNKKAFSLLLDSGVEVPLELFGYSSQGNYDYYSLVLAHGIPKEVIESYEAQHFVSDMIDRSLSIRYVGTRFRISDEEIDELFSTVKLLLESGFPPNPHKTYSRTGNSFFKQNANAIDCILESRFISQTTKDKFVELLRVHGGKSSSELAAENTIAMPPETPIDEIPEIFKTASEIFLKSSYKNNYRFSSSYPGIEAPVLVIDYGCSVLSKPYIKIYREKTFIHHRETPTRWNQTGEPFDIPAAFRIVLTPKGIRIPSRIHGDLPTMDIIVEEWLTFPTCEAYIERAIGKRVFEADRQDDLEALRRLCETESALSRTTTTIPGTPCHGIDRNELAYSVPEHYPLERCFQGVKSEHDFYMGPWSFILDERLSGVKELRKANELTRVAGIQGSWFYCSNFHHAIFSSNRNLRYLSAKEDHIVPQPNEFLVMVQPECSETIQKGDESIDYSKLHNGQYYWNCKAYKFTGRKRGAFIYVLFGDEASHEQFETVVEIARKVFSK